MLKKYVILHEKIHDKCTGLVAYVWPGYILIVQAHENEQL